MECAPQNSSFIRDPLDGNFSKVNEYPDLSHQLPNHFLRNNTRPEFNQPFANCARFVSHQTNYKPNRLRNNNYIDYENVNMDSRVTSTCSDLEFKQSFGDLNEFGSHPNSNSEKKFQSFFSELKFSGKISDISNETMLKKLDEFIFAQEEEIVSSMDNNENNKFSNNFENETVYKQTNDCLTLDKNSFSASNVTNNNNNYHFSSENYYRQNYSNLHLPFYEHNNPTTIDNMRHTYESSVKIPLLERQNTASYERSVVPLKDIRNPLERLPTDFRQPLQPLRFFPPPPQHFGHRFPPPPFPGMPPLSVSSPFPRPTNAMVASNGALPGLPRAPPLYSRPPVQQFVDPRLRFMTRPAARPPIHYPFPPPFVRMPPPHIIQTDAKPTLAKPEVPISLSTLNGDNIWVQNSAVDGRVYYYNWRTKQTTWDRPSNAKIISQSELSILLANKSQTIISSGPIQNVTKNADLTDSKSDEASDWIEYNSPDGRAYYHNRRSSMTTWTKPQVMIDRENETKVGRSNNLKTKEVKVKESKNEDVVALESSDESNGGDDDVENDSAKLKVIASKPVRGSVWYIVWTSNGRIFFYNPSKRLSIWERPEELKDRTDVDKLFKETPKELSGKSSEPPSKKQKIIHEKELSQNKDQLEKLKGKDMVTMGREAEEKVTKDREEMPLTKRIVLFKEMFKDKHVSPDSTWEKELHKIVFDPRYLLLTTSDRRSVFENYVREQQQQKKQFQNLLKESNLSVRSTFVDFVNKYGDEDRFRSMGNYHECEKLFDEFVAELQK